MKNKKKNEKRKEKKIPSSTGSLQKHNDWGRAGSMPETTNSILVCQEPNWQEPSVLGHYHSLGMSALSETYTQELEPAFS